MHGHKPHSHDSGRLPGGEGTFLQCLEPKEAADYTEPRALLALQTLEPPPPVHSTPCPQQGPAKGPRGQL